MRRRLQRWDRPPSKGALDRELDGLAEADDLDLHRQRRPAVSLIRVALVGEGEVELDRDRDQPEHAQRAAHAQVARERRRHLASRVPPLHREVDPGHHVDAAAGDADVERSGCAELDRGLELLNAGGVDLQMEEAAAAEDEDRNQEWVVASGDVEVDNRLPVGEGQRQRGAEGDVLQREDPDLERRQPEPEAGADAGGLAIRSRLGPSPKTPGGIAFLMSLTNLRSPSNLIGSAASCTSTDGFWPLAAVKEKEVKLTVTELRMLTSKSVSVPWKETVGG